MREYPAATAGFDGAEERWGARPGRERPHYTGWTGVCPGPCNPWDLGYAAGTDDPDGDHTDSLFPGLIGTIGVFFRTGLVVGPLMSLCAAIIPDQWGVPALPQPD
ncbi:MAG: hypothetical protein LUP97_03870 [Methanoregula sp.]|nr:hypothetical protein [Methanoregula sp.]